MFKLKACSNKELSEHQQNVINAAYTYVNLNWCTLFNLTRWFNVTENEISYWFIEAVTDNLLESDDVCEKLKNKHIEEYERLQVLENSSLRSIYNEAFFKRDLIKST